MVSLRSYRCMMYGVDSQLRQDLLTGASHGDSLSGKANTAALGTGAQLDHVAVHDGAPPMQS